MRYNNDSTHDFYGGIDQNDRSRSNAAFKSNERIEDDDTVLVGNLDVSSPEPLGRGRGRSPV